MSSGAFAPPSKPKQDTHDAGRTSHSPPRTTARSPIRHCARPTPSGSSAGSRCTSGSSRSPVLCARRTVRPGVPGGRRRILRRAPHQRVPGGNPRLPRQRLPLRASRGGLRRPETCIRSAGWLRGCARRSPGMRGKRARTPNGISRLSASGCRPGRRDWSWRPLSTSPFMASRHVAASSPTGLPIRRFRFPCSMARRRSRITGVARDSGVRAWVIAEVAESGSLSVRLFAASKH